MKKKRVLVVLLIIVLLIALGFIIFIAMNKDDRRSKVLSKYADKFYSYYYKENTDKKDPEKIKKFLANYKDTGLTISLKDLRTYLDTHKVEDYSLFSGCDEKKTKIIVYPISPYEKDNYRTEVKLKCK